MDGPRPWPRHMHKKIMLHENKKKNEFDETELRSLTPPSVENTWRPKNATPVVASLYSLALVAMHLYGVLFQH